MSYFKKSAKPTGLFITIVTLVLVSMEPITSHAATTPSLGMAASYGVLASTYTNTSSTTINGDVGFTTEPAVAPGGTHTNYGSGPPYATAGADQSAALTTLNAEPCTFTWGAAVDLSTDPTHGTVGVFTPGVYCSTGAMSVSAGLTLNGSGTYIFRAVGALDSTAGAVVSLSGGASACDVFWTPTAATTLGANTTFVGTVIDDTAITVGANTNWTGRALSFGGTVTTATSTITVPTCAAPPATLNVVKTVVNDNGRTKVVSDFPLFVSGTPVTSGDTNTFAPGSYAVTETTDPDYTQTFSGDCDASGNVSLVPGDNKFCIVTNDDIAAPVVVPPVPPLISVVKVPNPLTLPAGPGSVTYTFTLRNIGTVTATNITMVDDSCSPAALISGDTNANSQLEVSETWVYTCTTTLSQTHTNNVVATGLANSITATDIASASVAVNSAVTPPLIHLTKIPDAFTLLTGGDVTFTLRATNPGAVPLTNVSVVDDECSLLQFISGDTNSNASLDTTETWTYTCTANLGRTTTNTAIASGDANGLTARDFALATVVVASGVPGLPNTGGYISH